ncbi:autotransporter outer membrane beta-barrel domain-containing protein [Pseudomonas putida]|uniref:Autotransporter outer membrane beta-barrel domain-containing protein n=1 Tax=Pseudomonas putida TaxID=303 RepID=A0A2S3WY02_PSEPU|nr:autotransporter outer membrane beta-barrel domain-containing protein [Pseudomonas putida]POG06310.1 autotransporter outer membrane beta-barrel domain-containing protein [Pseudomonas putida]POG09047.1 autotransporter outer membrane beta-barrel domain-containing protein [Pseudomonas putida]
MSAFYPSPMRRALRIASLGPLLLLSPSSWALTTIEFDTTIDRNTAPDSFRVIKGATLTANGATTRQIELSGGSNLKFNASQINATGITAGLSVTQSVADLHDSRVTSERQGVEAGENAKINAYGSTIIGSSMGALVNTSELNLFGSHLEATNPNAPGVNLYDGIVNASAGSSIIGAGEGIRVRGDNGNPAGVGTVLLDASHVEGRTGSAITVGISGRLPTTADIKIMNGSTLKAGNGTLVRVGALSSADILVSASKLEGDIVVAEGGSAKLALENLAILKGRLENLDKLDLNSGGQWTLIGDAELKHLAMDGGAVAFHDNDDENEKDKFYALQVANLEGNGTFIMNVDFADGKTDFLEVTGNASGNHQIRVASTGKDPLADTNLHMVHTAAGDASFSLAGGPVDLGTFAYGLVQHGNDWYLDASMRSLSNGTKTILALANTAPTVWYGELTTLRSRMGEVRRNDGAAGAWMRSYGNQYNASTSGFGYKQQQQGLSFGADGRLPAGDGNWLLGVTAGYSNSDLNLQGGSSGKVDSYHIGAYTTWLDPQSGYYFDGVAKFNRYQNRADVQLSDGSKTKGDYSNHGLGVSAEVGRHIKLDDGYFIEPYAQLAAMTIEGQSYHLANGMQASGDDTRSLQGKLGATAGRTFDYGQGRMIQPYLKVAGAHEFVNNNRVKVNGNSLDNDLAGSRAELGVGVVAAWAEQWQVHAEFDYANGERLEQPWGASVGVRYNW